MIHVIYPSKMSKCLLPGSMNDAGIWLKTALREALEQNTIHLPEAHLLPYTDRVHPFALVGDEGFPLKTYLVRPFPRRNLQNVEAKIFNYRLSRARRIVENAFGILVARWKILQRPLAVKLSTAEAIIQVTVCLHNFIMKTKNNQYFPHGIVDFENYDGEITPGNWRGMIGENNFLHPLGRIGANIGTTAAIRQRESLAQYFTSDEGSIPWQWRIIE